MKGKFCRVLVLSVSLLAVLWTCIGNPSSSDAAGSEIHGKAVIIQCVVNTGPPEGGAPPVILVYGTSSSEGAPVVQNGSQCAQALASVLAAGFQLFSVTISPFAVTEYTLIK